MPVFQINVSHLKDLEDDHYTEMKAGQSAQILTYGGVIHPEIAQLLPSTTIIPLVSLDGEQHRYFVTVRGYTIEQFAKIVGLIVEDKWDEAMSLIETISPPRRRGL